MTWDSGGRMKRPCQLVELRGRMGCGSARIERRLRRRHSGTRCAVQIGSSPCGVCPSEAGFRSSGMRSGQPVARRFLSRVRR